MLVRDIPHDFDYVSDSQTVNEINKQFRKDYDVYFVRIQDGEYVEIYGMFGIVPVLTREVSRVLGEPKVNDTLRHAILEVIRTAEETDSNGTVCLICGGSDGDGDYESVYHSHNCPVRGLIDFIN